MSDTNEITQGCLVHYDNQHLQVRKDFLSICAYKRTEFEERPKQEPDQECMAKILRLLETLTDHQKTEWKLKARNAMEKGLKVPPEPKEYPIELTYGAINWLLAMQEPDYVPYGESTIRNSVAYLLHLKHIKRDQLRKNSIPIYWLAIDHVQECLKQKAESRLSGVEINSQTQVLKSTAKRVISTPRRLKSTATPPISTPSDGENNTNNNSNSGDTSENDNKGDTPLDAPTPARAEHHALQEKISDTAARLKAIGANDGQANNRVADMASWTNCDPIASSSTDDMGEDQSDIPTTPRLPKVTLTKGDTNDGHGRGRGHGGLDASQQTVRVHPEPAGPVVQTDGAAPALPPQAGTIPGTDRSGPRQSGAAFHIPTRPRQNERPKMEKPQLTLEGSQVKEWLQAIWGTTISMRAGNVTDLNDLGANPDVAYESLKTTLDYIESRSQGRKHTVTITLHILSGNDANFAFLSFENNWSAARRKKQAPRQSDTLSDGKTSSIYAI